MTRFTDLRVEPYVVPATELGEENPLPIFRNPVQDVELAFRDAVPAEERENNFVEVELTMVEKQARKEAGRCLSCGPCSECMACLEVCEPGAVIHNQQESIMSLEISGWVTSGDITASSPVDCQVTIEGIEPMAGASAAFEVIHSIQP